MFVPRQHSNIVLQPCVWSKSTNHCYTCVCIAYRVSLVTLACLQEHARKCAKEAVQKHKAEIML